jgi:hypothetical protein
LLISSSAASTRDKELIEATAFPAQMRRTSISSIPAGIQRLGAISQGDTGSGVAHPEPATEGVSSMSTQATKHSTNVSAAVAAGVVLFSLLSPAMAASDQSNPAVLTSHSPWLAPTGHRQPARADVPQNEVLSAWERQQQDFDVELDRKLIICRGC